MRTFMDIIYCDLPLEFRGCVRMLVKPWNLVYIIITANMCSQ